MPLSDHRIENREVDPLARRATLFCLAGCGVGEILDLVIGAALSSGLGFLLGYTLTLVSMLRSGLTLGRALGLALATDAISTTLMEIFHAMISLLISGAMHAGPDSLLFWVGLAAALSATALAAYPVNRWLIAREHACPAIASHPAETHHD